MNLELNSIERFLGAFAIMSLVTLILWFICDKIIKFMKAHVSKPAILLFAGLGSMAFGIGELSTHTTYKDPVLNLIDNMNMRSVKEAQQALTTYLEKQQYQTPPEFKPSKTYCSTSIACCLIGLGLASVICSIAVFAKDNPVS